jgi:uncharacterized protein
VSEAGASIYSVSATAQAELPQLEAAERGAVTIARRLLDPLAELIKLDPTTLGVGEYRPCSRDQPTLWLPCQSSCPPQSLRQ